LQQLLSSTHQVFSFGVFHGYINKNFRLKNESRIAGATKVITFGKERMQHFSKLYSNTGFGPCQFILFPQFKAC
jgi:hypothetical protein